jgi:hypothetical protein
METKRGERSGERRKRIKEKRVRNKEYDAVREEKIEEQERKGRRDKYNNGKQN